MGARRNTSSARAVRRTVYIGRKNFCGDIMTFILCVLLLACAVVRSLLHPRAPAASTPHAHKTRSARTRLARRRSARATHTEPTIEVTTRHDLPKGHRGLIPASAAPAAAALRFRLHAALHAAAHARKAPPPGDTPSNPKRHARTTTRDDEKMLRAHMGTKPETPIDGASENWAVAPATGPRCARGRPPSSSHASVA